MRPPHRWTTLLWLPWLAMAWLGLAACSDDAADPTAGPGTESSSDSPGADPSSPGSADPDAADPDAAVPDAAQGTDAASAKAFVRFWVDLASFAEATGETRALSSVTSPDCRSCVGVIRSIAGLHAAGGSMDAEGWSVRGLEARRVDEETMLVRGRLRIGPSEMRRPDGSVQEFEGTTRLTRFRLREQGSTWQLASLDVGSR